MEEIQQKIFQIKINREKIQKQRLDSLLLKVNNIYDAQKKIEPTVGKIFY